MSDEKGQSVPARAVIDWEALWRDHAAGMSLRDLEAKHGAARATIARRAIKEGRKGGGRAPGQSEAGRRREARAQAQAMIEAAWELGAQAPVRRASSRLADVSASIETGETAQDRQLVTVTPQVSEGKLEEARRMAEEATPLAVEAAVRLLNDPRHAIKAAALLFDVAKSQSAGGSKRLGDMTAAELKALAAELRGREKVIEGEVLSGDAGK